MLVAIDGPAGAGKSTVARALAQALGFRHLDSGAMYRCVALLTLQEPETAPSALARGAAIELAPAAAAATAAKPGPEVRPPEVEAAEVEDSEVGGPEPGDPGIGGRVLLDGHDVTGAIRAPAVSEAASHVAADPDVRAALVIKQRELLARGDWVAEGRDIGAVVAPDAELKVFLTASPEERARRRALELGVAPGAVLAEQTLRDARDSTRAHSPLRPAPGAVTLDTGGLSVAEVVGRIAAILQTQC